MKFLAALLLAVVAVVALTACDPSDPAQVAAYLSLPEGGPERAAIDEHLRVAHAPPPAPVLPAFLLCVIRHESATSGLYVAENPYSSASGAYQFIDSTWVTLSARAGYPGWGHASWAPPWVQDAVAIWTLANVGRSPWAGTGC